MIILRKIKKCTAVSWAYLVISLPVLLNPLLDDGLFALARCRHRRRVGGVGGAKVKVVRAFRYEDRHQ